MTHIEELGKLLDDFTKIFDQLNTLQQEKMQAVHQDDLPALEHCMQREQAISLQIRGMQRQKEKVDEALGLKNIPFHQLSDHLSTEHQKQLAPVFSRFQAAYEQYRSAASSFFRRFWKPPCAKSTMRLKKQARRQNQTAPKNRAALLISRPRPSHLNYGGNNMISTFGSFSMAKLGIRSSQQGLQITGNNITNINTNGYTRQRINQISLYHGTADRYSVSTDVRMGIGSLVTSVSQIRDPFLDIRYRNEASNVGFYDEKLANLEELQAVLDEVSKDGIHTNIEEIRTQLQNLANNPTSKEHDTLVRSACQKLVSLLNKYSADLKTQKENALQGFDQNVDGVNKILSQIRDLNIEIRKSQIHGDPALEMIDNRNLLIDQLSEMTKIKVSYSKEQVSAGIFVDKLTIEMDAPGQDPANRPILVDGSFANKLEISPLGQDGKPDATAEDYKISLGGLTNTKGESPLLAEIKEQMENLNSLTNSMQGVNKQLADVNKQMEAWKQSLGANGNNFAEQDFGANRDKKLKELQKAVDDARKALAQKPGDTFSLSKN